MTTKTWLSAAFSCLTLSLAACGGQSNAPANHSASHPAPAAASGASGTADGNGRVLRVAGNATFAPFESLDANKKVTGFDIDLINAMGEAGNFKVEYQDQPWESLFPALSNGDADVLVSGITITDERKATMAFSEPYYQITQVVLVPPSKNVAKVEDLKKLHKIGVVTGYTGDYAAQKIFGPTSEQVVRFDNVGLLTKEVENGGVDAGILDNAVVAHYIKNNSSKGFKMVALPDFPAEHYGMAVRKDDAQTLALLNDSLAKVRASGKYAEIEAKYFATDK